MRLSEIVHGFRAVRFLIQTDHSNHTEGVGFASQIQNQEEGIMIEINLPRAVELIENAIKAKPKGYKYSDDPWLDEGYNPEFTTCSNVLANPEDNDEVRGACIVGTILVDAGVDPKFFKQYSCSHSGVFAVSDNLLDANILHVTSAARHYLGGIQSRQDNDKTWISSHEEALLLTLTATWVDEWTAEELAFRKARETA